MGSYVLYLWFRYLLYYKIESYKEQESVASLALGGVAEGGSVLETPNPGLCERTHADEHARRM